MHGTHYKRLGKRGGTLRVQEFFFFTLSYMYYTKHGSR